MSGGDSSEAGARLRRLRWRLRGAWLWPTFVVATLLEATMLHWLPVQGDSARWIGALLAAGLPEPRGDRRARRAGRDPAAPPQAAICRDVVAADYAGTLGARGGGARAR